MRILITGISGFAGSYLAELMVSSRKYEVFGLIRWRSNRDNIEHILDCVSLIEGDVRDQSSLTEAIETIRPDCIFHLAAQSFVPASWNAPAESISTNVLGTLNLFEAVRKAGIKPRILVACSSEEYGCVEENSLPVREDCPLRPLSPYAVSKVGQDMLSYQYYRSYGMDIVRTRAFNHTGPRRPEVFVCSSFARQLALIEAGLSEGVIKAGNLDSIRDFTDVRDVVAAYSTALQVCPPGSVYNICSGRGHRISDVLQMLISMSDVNPEIILDQHRMRPSDVPVLIGDPGRFERDTAWKPELSLKQTLQELLDFWRRKVRK